MKSKFWLICLAVMTQWLRETLANNCTAPFQEVPYGSGSYCAKCDTTCDTCSASSINRCKTCPADFTLDTNSSICAPPVSALINTVANSYHSFGFLVQPSWLPATTTACGVFTILTPSGSTLTTTHTLGIHYQVRIRVAFWSLSGPGVTLGLQYTNLNSAYNISKTSPGTVTSLLAGQTYNPTCTNAAAVNYEQYIDDHDKDVTNAQVTFSSSGTWGINQYIFIEYLCSQPDCASCFGPGASNCTSCSSSIKTLYSNPGPCLCNFALGYYAYPTGNTTYFCVNPCPNMPSGQYYGDNFTKNCVLSCPVNSSNTGFWNLSFASDEYGFCVNECPRTITLGGTLFDLFYDLVGRKCTTQCPTAQPYSNPYPNDRACYSACPINSGVQYYMLKTTMTCVATCPTINNSTDGVQIPLYRDPTTLTCVQVCISGYWGYSNTTIASNVDRYCIINNCPTGSGQFTDNSTGRPLCTITCAAPNWFGDYYISPPACVTTCTFPNFGDQYSTDRFCVPKCNGSYFGIQSGTRQCVKVCPSGTWGNNLNLVCVTSPNDCRLMNITYTNTSLSGNYSFSTLISAFADNFTNLCVWANDTCSNSMYKLNSSYTCQLSCPNGTYANNNTFWCVDRCYGTLFSDYLLNKCVEVCSPGLYADIGSGNACVTRCNQTGGYPYRDSTTRQCVSVCTNGYADPTAQLCTYNCTPGLYLNGTDTSNQTYKVCATNCSSPYFAYNNTDSGICLMTCPNNPPLFGDVVAGLRVCVEVCQAGTYGNQVNTSYRHCVSQCQNGTFAQNDSSRLCVIRCNSSTYGRTTDWTCVDPLNCPDNYTGDPTTNLCVYWCPPSNGTFSDNVSKLCVSKCPTVNGTIYYADIHIRWCIPTCVAYNSSVIQFGNNSTQTCEQSCLDNDSYADAQSPRRYCIALCTDTSTTRYYRNNFTMTCVVSTSCTGNYFADNYTAYCVKKCSLIPNTTNTTNSTQTWGYIPTKTCVSLCLPGTFGDLSTGIPLCVSLCPQYPVPKWSYLGPSDNMTVMLCMTMCPPPYFGQDFLRTCVTSCPLNSSQHGQTYSYDITRRCLLQCPNTTFADYIAGICYHYSINCTIPCWYSWTNCTTYRWGDPYNNSCTYLCTASPWDTYGDNATQTCTTNCSANSYADNYTGTRTCIAQCPGYYDIQGVVDGTKLDIRGVAYDSYGDNFTQRCVQHCVMPSTYADWQTHLCTYRCTGDLNTTVPTYANIISNRCVIALFCPVTPDLYFGENITRWCLPACPLNSTYVSFADNLTRTCIPVCYEKNYATTPNNLTTRFYGDKTTGRPACVVACSVTPPQFGRNDTNLCVDQCPNNQYGDQTGNRSCVATCPSFSLNNGTLNVTWFSQLTSRICVLVCENGTWGNYYNSIGPHCETVGTDCKPGQFADNSTHLCVDVCPESMNYFGDPSTRLCTDRCPYLNASVVNTTVGVNESAGRLFADYKTRICVHTCPADFGLQGTFGDNSTNTCVQRCPSGSYGDASTVNRFCVAQCTNGGFADTSTMLCVDICPASPPTYGYSGNWTCVKVCPDGLWADSLTRTCTSSCNPDFRLTLTNECVGTCPSNPDLYADTNGYNCTPVCSLGQYADPTDRTCKGACSSPLFQYNYRCVQRCPLGYFANTSKDCVPPKSCQAGYYGDNSTTECVSPCPDWSFADDASGYCIAICPAGTYGENNVCVANCSSSNSASNITQLCESTCPNSTFSSQGVCVTNCTNNTYQNEVNHICGACPGGLFADPTTHRCVVTCPYGWYRQTNGAKTGQCVPEINGCAPQFADFHTGNCLDKCSTGYWGFANQTNTTNTYVGNYTCLALCPDGLYGYQNLTESVPQRTCYPPNGLPGSPNIFADSLSRMFVAVCPDSPVLYFGDRNRKLCVRVCESYSGVLYYGDPQSRQCQTTCKNSTYTADNSTKLCTLRCTYGSFRFNDTPVCTNPCPTGYGDYTTRICVATCPISAGTYGYHYNSTRICINPCPANYFSQPLTRTCTTSCPHATTPYYYAYNATRECLLECKSSFAFDDTFQCVSQCSGTNSPFADNSTNKCVPVCPSSPDYYGDSNVCVFFCTTAGYFADSNGRLCRPTCTNTSTYIQYGDPKTGKCEQNCSYGTWGDNSTHLCTLNCSAGSYADNTTGVCVADCPKIENIYADPILNVCAYTCSGGYFGSQVNQTCIPVCDDGYWGDPTTTLCTPLCPVKIYSYGQNYTRRCVSSCIGVGYTGYADNYSRLCREYCQHTLTPQTYISYSTASCVEKCPTGTWAANYTATNNSINQCVTFCPSGFADNYSQWCVAVCPSDPESYGDVHSRICIYSCRFGQFSDNSTNLCVVQCPSLNNTPAVDYYGDNITGRCVLWCTEGTYAQNHSRLCVNPCDNGEFADNLTRRCVTNCPPSESTFADSTTNRCVRICPHGYWAENSTQACVSNCWTYTNASFYPIGTQSYADNLTNFCVAQCPFGYFGTNFTHKCVSICPASLNEYGHPVGRVCVGTSNSTNVVDCYGDNSTNNTYYGDPISRLCVQKCPFDSWADTHLFKCVTQCDSTIPEFRNNHTQMCVTPCPTDPDEFGDSSTGNCVRTCPPGSFAYTGNRTCLPSCGQFGLFADNTTNRCVSKCATEPYLYADNHTWTCVLRCSDGQFADNRSQTCVITCPVQWAYFGETTTYTCVSLCPSGTYADANNGRTCQPTCSSSYFADNYTSSCVQHCMFVRPFWYEDTSSGSGFCVHVCPGESYAYNPDQTCKYQNPTTLASTCPGAYYADTASRQCVKFCPNGTFANINTKYCESTCGGSDYADPILRKCMPSCSGNLFQLILAANNNVCKQYCPYPYYAQNSSGGNPSQCVTNCTALGLPSTRTCEDYCPRPYFADWTQHLCILNCTPKYQYVPNRTCLSTCEAPYYGNPINFTCDLLCPNGYFGRNDTRMCDTGCPSFSFADPTIRICVSNCPAYPPLFADSRFSKCLSSCSSPLFGYEVNMSCISFCPNLTQGNRTLVYLADESNRLCVLSCVNDIRYFADYTKNQCTQFCPNGSFASNYTKECVTVCPNEPNDTFSDNTSHICMDVCLPGSYGMSSLLNCVASCWWPFYADPTTRRCVDFCPLGLFADNTTASCRPTCPAYSYADPVTHRCLLQCPAQQSYYNYATNWTCLQSCPSGFFANTDTNSCEPICNSSSGMFAYLPTNLCVRQCPIPYRGYAPNYTCVLSCPSRFYFYDVTINVCAECDPTCVVCSSLSTCLECQPGYNLFNGYCSQTCIPTNGVITYADPNGICVTVCPNTYFGYVQNTTYACTQTCPQKMYGDAGTHLCSNCPALCATCTSLTLCLTCNTAATLAIDNMCYSDCNSTFKYSYNNTCYNICPSGTYLTYTGVTCAACAPICLTCFGAGSACTSCATTYFFNSTCLTTCPSGYYGSTTLQCLTCSGSSNAACTSPLSFSTSYSTQNFQPVITLQFNQNVTMTKNISDILQINLQLKRRLEERWLQVGSIVNNGITYTYEILSNGTIKLYPQISVSLLSPTFSVTISDPAAVTSTATGVSLQNVQSLLAIAALQYYPLSDGVESGTNIPAKLVTVAVLILYAITFVFSDVMVRPLQMLQMMVFHCLIAVGVPANIYYFLFQAKNSTLDFVQNWFKGYLPATSPYYNTPLKVADVFVDEIFLRHIGQFFVLLVVLACFWFVFLILGNKRITTHKIWQGFFEKVSQKRYQLMVINDLFSLFYFPMLYFAFMQLPLIPTSSGFYSFNFAVTVILLLAAAVVPVAWLVMWKVKTPEEVEGKLWFLTIRTKANGNGGNLPIHDEKGHEHIRDKSSVHSEQVEQRTERNPHQLQGIVFYAYQLLMAIWMVALYSSPKAQLVLLILTNILLLIYQLKARPHLNIINLLFTVLFLLFLILIQCIYLYFLDNPSMTAAQKTNIAFPILIAADAFCVLMFLWAMWRFVWEASYYWNSFKKTQLYLQFADHDYVGEEEETEKYSVYEKKAEKMAIGLGDIVIDEIIERVGRSGEKIIAVKKKRLRKKLKAQPRQKHGQMIPQEEISSREEFVRVNNFNVFDYDEHQFDEEPEKSEPEPQQVRPRRNIDDDLRDLVSDNSEQLPRYQQEEEEKKIEVEPGEELISNLDSLSAVEEGRANHESEKASENPFLSIQQEEHEEEKMGEEEVEPEEYYKIDEYSKKPSPRQPSEKKSEEGMESEEIKKESQQSSQRQQKESEHSDHNPSEDNAFQQLKSEQSALPHEPQPASDEQVVLPAPKIKNLEDLLQQQQSAPKKKNLLFLFDDFDEQS